jgi:hypothetical protein
MIDATKETVDKKIEEVQKIIDEKTAENEELS